MTYNAGVGVIGLGYVGSCLAAAIAAGGSRVVGVDTDARLVEELSTGHCRFQELDLQHRVAETVASGALTVTDQYAKLADVDVVLVTVGTPIRDDGELADGQLRAACRALGEHLRRGQLVVLKSTVPPGTVRSMAIPLLESGGLRAGTDFSVAFCPERLAEGNALADVGRLPVVVGGLDAASTSAAERFWREALGVEVIALDSLEAAEITKLADNWWIDLNIALANELAKYCALYGVDALDVIRAANSLPKGAGTVNILLPSVGVGGSCLTKDPWMVRYSAAERGLSIETVAAGRRVNDGMPDYTAELILGELAAAGKTASDARVAILGLAFKNDTGDLRATPARGVISALIKAGVQVSAYDPLVDGVQAKEQLGVRPAATLDEAAQNADCLAILAYHRCFADIDYAALPVNEACLLFDGRAYFPKDKIARIRALGYHYRGIGR